MSGAVGDRLVFALGEFDKTSGHETAHGLLKNCLAEYGIDLAEEGCLSFNEHGKPSLKGHEAVKFNLSHSKGICACIVSGCECGVDCESVREYRPKVAVRCFSPAEQRALDKLDGGERDLMFFRLWTLKEAYVKALGIGISYPMNKAEFWFEGEKLYTNISDFTFEQYIINGGKYVLSVCKQANGENAFVRQVNTQDKLFFIR